MPRLDRVKDILNEARRLNGTQRVVAIATFSDGALQAAVAEVEVTAAACMDGS